MNNNLASREIMWNVSSLADSVAMYSLLFLALVIGLSGIWRQTELWKSGKPAKEHTGNYLQRFWDLLYWGGLQRGVIKEKSVAAAHTLIYIGFLMLLFTTTMVMIDHDFGIKIYHGQFYLLVTVFSDVLGFGVLLGCAVIAYRRYIEKPEQLHNKPADFLFLGILVLLIVQGFLLEALRIHATKDPWAAYSPVGLIVAKFFWFLSVEATKLIHYILWWFHTITVFSVIAVIPYTKAFHIILSGINLFFRSNKLPKGALKSPGNIEQLMETEDDFTLGTGDIRDYSWKQLMDLDSCTSCGRCQDACPAHNSGKPLSPKWLILNTRNHAVSLNAEGKIGNSILPSSLKKIDKFLTFSLFLKTSGAEEKERTPAQTIAGEVMSPDVFWSCTTCYACVNACPVGINQMEQIIDNRRNMVLMRGEMPTEAQNTLRTIETQANPYGAAEDRSRWFEDLDLPVISAGDEVDYLYWVGCVSAYDKRKQSIARSLVKIMQTAGLSFGVLGNAEGCTGDPARRLGEENLFQMMAKQNIELLNSVKFKVLVANCPHCFNTIKNEYPHFGNLGNGRQPEIIHHSKLLKQLLAEGKIKLNPNAESYTFHDPCYLGRYNDEYDAPREALQKTSSLKILEMEESKEKAKCCGAGGGHFWMDLKLGERINVQRVEQATATGAKKIATACPFCLQMMEDGVKLTNKEEELEVKDIAEVIAEQIIS